MEVHTQLALIHAVSSAALILCLAHYCASRVLKAMRRSTEV